MKSELKQILEKHQKWLFSALDGLRADLRGADLRGVDLRGVDLRGADLSYSNLSDVDLGGANLSYSNLSYADLRGADLRGVDLRGGDLRGGDLRGIDLSYTNLRSTNLRDADLRGADLSDADLSYTNLRGIKANHATSFYHLQCPEEGSFIGYKRANNCIVKLLIPEDALRSSATSRKCRTNKAKVLEITRLLDGETSKQVPSDYDSNFVYKVGEIVVVDDFDTDRWNECSTGIHFFITKQEAIDYV